MESSINKMTEGLNKIAALLEKNVADFKKDLEKNPNLANEFKDAFKGINLQGNINELRNELSNLSKLK